MLSDPLKKEIQDAYKRLLDSRAYAPRYCQRRMVADIANTLGNIETDDAGDRISDGHICVVEAGTGTGKTVAYSVAAIPLAKALGKRLVIATATVALQEQIVLRDLPDIRQHAGLDFSFTLAKGRRRYLCLSRLDKVLQSHSSTNHLLPLYDDEVNAGSESDLPLYESMLNRLGRGEWDGDRDSLREEVPDPAWLRVSTDHIQCTGRQCSHFHNCYFYKAREQIHKVDVVVTNQDLVLSDLMMGGGAVLPPPEDTIYVFDEGHHLPEKAIGHFSNFVQIRSTQTWLEQIPSTLKQLIAEIGEEGNMAVGMRPIEERIQELTLQLSHALQHFSAFSPQSEPDGDHRRYRFVRGEIEPDLRTSCGEVLDAQTRLVARIEPLRVALEDSLAIADEADREPFERWLPVVASIVARLSASAALWVDYTTPDSASAAPKARWIVYRDDDVVVNASPVAIDGTLDDLLWSRCFGAVVTSATLAVGGNFERYRQRAGIGSDNTFNALPSPFRFAEQATLRIPAMAVDPRDPDSHSAAVASMMPSLMQGVQGGLVLFTSWRQMFQVMEMLEPEFRDGILAQGALSKAEMVTQHKQRIDDGHRSIIFGLASFAEGIDLPGNYCDHVVVVKIPFAVPDDPVGATLSEWIEARGGNAFQEIMIPDAALRMVQACGRLLRTETDTGVITILDRRLVTQRYGAMLLDALPPFRREIA